MNINGSMAKVNISGSMINVSIKMLDDAAVGEFVMVHAGYAISKVDVAEKEKMDALAKEIAALMSEG